MLSKHTPNYDLSQWERTAALETQAAQIAKRGNCKFYHGTYRGTGGIVGVGYPNSFTFPGGRSWLSSSETTAWW